MSGLSGPAIHEAAHATAAHATGAATVHSMSLNSYGGCTAALFDENVELRPVLITTLAGYEGELLVVGTADARRSYVDFEYATKCALAIAKDEEHGPGPSPTSGRVEQDSRAAIARLAGLTEGQIAAAVERMTARRAARAEVIVKEAQEEARSLIASHLCVVRLLALALSRYQFLDEPRVVALLAEGMERQHEDDRRHGGNRRGA